MNDTKAIRSSDLKRLLGVLFVFSAVAGMLTGYYMLFFEARGNFRQVVRQKVYRSAQPSSAQLKNWTQRYGIRTVLSLRGHAHEVTDQEQAAVSELGIRMISIPIRSYRILSRNSLHKLIEAMETVELPVLIHCRDGIDRGGMASALAAMAIGKQNYNRAKWEAYVPPGPWKRRRKRDYFHISDVFKDYEQYRRGDGPANDDWHQFKRWANDETASNRYVK